MVSAQHTSQTCLNLLSTRYTFGDQSHSLDGEHGRNKNQDHMQKPHVKSSKGHGFLKNPQSRTNKIYASFTGFSSKRQSIFSRCITISWDIQINNNKFGIFFPSAYFMQQRCNAFTLINIYTNGTLGIFIWPSLDVKFYVLYCKGICFSNNSRRTNWSIVLILNWRGNIWLQPPSCTFILT